MENNDFIKHITITKRIGVTQVCTSFLSRLSQLQKGIFKDTHNSCKVYFTQNKKIVRQKFEELTSFEEQIQFLYDEKERV